MPRSRHRDLLTQRFAEVRLTNPAQYGEEFIWKPDLQTLRNQDAGEGFAYYAVAEAENLVYIYADPRITNGSQIRIVANHIARPGDFPVQVIPQLVNRLIAKFGAVAMGGRKQVKQ